MRCLILCFLLLPLASQSQQPGGPPSTSLSGSIAGVLVDSVTGTPIEYAAVGILDKNSRVVNGSITDAAGSFRVIGLPLGEYKIQVNFIGYAVKTISGIFLIRQRPDYDAGRIILIPESQLLEEIRISGEAALIEAKPDKIVYNAEKDVTSSGGDASDVLRKVPMLSVDLDGNVSMRGSENVKILINGRPSGMFSNNVADALKMMPAHQIKSVEVITSPSAKYDGEGTAGIINIITRKKNIEGVAGSIDLTAGTRAHRGNGNVSYGKGRLGLNLSAGGHYNTPQSGATSFMREEFLGTSSNLLTQEGINTSSRLGFRTHAGFEYNINPLNTLSSEFSYRRFTHENKNDVASEYITGVTAEEQYQRIVDGQSTRSGWDWELDYKKEFLKKGQEWSVAVEIDHDDDDSEYQYFQSYIIPETQDLLESNLNLGDNLEITAETDYIHPFGERVILETGLKGTLRQITSDFNYRRFDPDLSLWLDDPSRTDIFYYDQNVYAAYASSTIQFGERNSLIAGVRMEMTDLKGEFQKFDNPFDNQYLSVLPNITLSRKMGEYNQIKLSYSQRIQRPNQRHINPFTEYNDNKDISYGNPSLSPENIHQLEFGSTFFIGGNMISSYLFARRTEDLIENLVTLDAEGVSTSTYYNFGRRNSVGLNVFGSLNLGKAFTLRGGFDVNLWETEGDFDQTTLSNSGYDYNGRLNLSWAVTKSLRMEGFTFFRSPVSTVQGKNPSWSFMSVGLKQELFKRRLTIGINLSEPFRENLVFEREIEGTGFIQHSRTLRPVRSVGINVGYNFGKLDFKERSGRKKDNNNDLKEDDFPADQPFNGQ
jgi:outer membrane receptor for ferrienterochelin and colicin